MNFTTFLEKNDYTVTKLGSLETLEINDIPIKKGVYIFCSTSTKFIYPNSTSNVIYIGKADNLQTRLKRHQFHLVNIKSYAEKEKHSYWTKSLYNYLDKHGDNVYFISAEKNKNAHNLEGDIFEVFFKKYLSIPVGNGAYSSGKKNRK